MRRDLIFHEIFQTALEGNSDRQSASRYQHLYDTYKGIYKRYLFEDKEEIAKQEEERRKKERESMMIDKAQVEASIAEAEEDLTAKLAAAATCETLLKSYKTSFEREKGQAALAKINDEIIELEKKISERTFTIILN